MKDASAVAFFSLFFPSTLAVLVGLSATVATNPSLFNEFIRLESLGGTFHSSRALRARHAAVCDE